MQYILCSDAEIEMVYQAFRIGFSDYMIKLDISQEAFTARFFGPEGNRRAYSYLAMDENRLVGVILGGMKVYEGIKTLRCGALCVDPSYRGKGISRELFRLHKQIALENGCQQLFLEVIKGNERAERFYNSLGYEKLYDLCYYSLADASSLERILIYDTVVQLGYEDVAGLAAKIGDVHINWQNDFDYMSQLEGLSYYGIFKQKELVAAISISLTGRVLFLWTSPDNRHMGMGSSLLANAVKDLGLKSLSISFPNNAKLHGFIKHLGFTKDKLSQYEMYMTL